MSLIPTRPVLRSHLVPRVEAGIGVLLLSPAGERFLPGTVFERLVPLLDGTRTADEVAMQLAGSLPPERVYFALAQLAKGGWIRERGECSPAVAAFWDPVGVDPDEAEARVAATLVHFDPVGFPPREDAAEALASHGLCLSATGGVRLTLARHYLDPRVASAAAEARSAGVRWIPCSVTGRSLWMGPLFAPDGRPCFQCLRHRLLQTHPVQERLLRDGEDVELAAAGAGSLTTRERLGLGILADRLRLALGSGDHSTLLDAVLVHDLVEHTGGGHPVALRPQCPTCGPGKVDGAGGWPRERVASPRHPTTEGGFRTAPPEVTLAAFSRHVSPVTGIVPSLRRLAVPGAGFMWAFRSGPNVALPIHEAREVVRGPGTTSLGKGASEQEARVSALGEAIELYSSTLHGDEARTRARMSELEGAVHPNDCMHFSEAQYRSRDRTNPLSGPLNQVPEPFDPDVAVEWTRVWSLTDERARYLPTELLYFGTVPPGALRTCVPTPNGLAAGNTREEALLHALLELIERDAVATWWYNRISRPGVRVPQAPESLFRRVTQAYEAMGREWWALDLTHDLSVPCFAAVTRRVGRAAQEILMGFGAHLDPAVALRRAVTEMHQVLTVVENTPDASAFGPEFTHWIAEATVEGHGHLLPAAAPAVDPGKGVEVGGADLREYVDHLHGLLRARGLELLVLDQTRPEIGVPVVRAVVPGLRHFRPRVAPGRLYEVPVELGWLDVPHAEADLNSTPLIV